MALSVWADFDNKVFQIDGFSREQLEQLHGLVGACRLGETDKYDTFYELLGALSEAGINPNYDGFDVAATSDVDGSDFLVLNRGYALEVRPAQSND